MELFHNAVGIGGTMLIIIAYLLLQTGRISSEQLTYSLLNLIGAGCVVFSLCFEWNLPSFIVESFWVLISLIGIARYINRNKQTE